MTLDEARKVMEVVSEADGGCSRCVEDLVDVLNSAFPEFYFYENGGLDGDDRDDWRVMEREK